MSLRVLSAAGLLLLAASGHCAPYVPRSDDEVLERLPVRPNDPAMREIKDMRAALVREPENLKLAMRLARRYFDQAAAQGDPRYVGYSQAALASWWNLPQPPVGVIVMRATLRQYRHDFEGALQDIELALKRDPGEFDAWSLRADINVVQANYSASRDDCARMAAFVTELTNVGCVAFIDGLNGRARQSHDALSSALARAKSVSPEHQLWVLTRLAEMAWRMNESRLAEDHFRRALSLQITDGFLLAAYADFLLDYNRPQEVIALLKDWTRSDPLLLRLTLAEQAVNAKTFAEHKTALVDRYAAARLRGDTTHEQEESRFCLQVLRAPEQALTLAQNNWRVQREPRDARVLLEAAVATRRIDAAQPVLDWMGSTAIEDGTLRRLAAQLVVLRKGTP